MAADPQISFDARRAQEVLDRVAPGHRFLSTAPAPAAFTNQVHLLDGLSPSGARIRLVVKQLTESRDPVRATAEFHGLQIALRRGVPAPTPLLLDASGEILGVPGIVTTFVEGVQIASPKNLASWAERQADILLRIHAINPSPDESRNLYDGNEIGLYFLDGHWPEKNAGHPLSETIYSAVRELRPGISKSSSALLHVDYWPGNVLWRDGCIAAVLDWDGAAVGDPALDVAYFRMDMHLRGIREAADIFLNRYEAGAGRVRDLGFWELAAAARPLPNPVAWIPAARQMGNRGATDQKAVRDYFDFVAAAIERSHSDRT